MNGVLKLINLLADILNYLVEEYRKSKAQASTDRIDADPAGEFLRRFKRIKDSSNSSSKPS